jgi:TIMELESS-interacting protein
MAAIGVSSRDDEEKEKEGGADELIVKKKKKRTKRPFTEDILMEPDGLHRILEDFPVSCRFNGRGNEAKDVKKLMGMYREWAFQLHPGLSFADVLHKCEGFGVRGKMGTCMQDLRDRERDRYIVCSAAY